MRGSGGGGSGRGEGVGGCKAQREGERRDSQSMKRFDNLVICFLQIDFS